MASFSISVEDSSPIIAYAPAGAWTDTPIANDPLVASYSGKTFHTTSTQGATATLNFNGTGVTIIGAQRPNYGTPTLLVDGKEVSKCISSGPTAVAQQTLCSATGLPYGPHTAVLQNTDGSPMDIDRIDLQTQVGSAGSKMSVTTYDDSDPRVSYLPSASDWSTNAGAQFMGGTLHYTQIPGASASLQFSGDAIAVYGTVSPDHLNIRVTVDGQSTTSTSGSGGFASGLHTQVLIYFGTDLGPGQHTLTIAGDPQPGNGPFLDFDYVSVYSADATVGATSSSASATPTTNAQAAESTVKASPLPTEAARHSSSKAAIIGGSIGGFFGLLLLLSAFLFVWRMRRRRPQSKRPRITKSRIFAPRTPELPMQGDPNMMEAGFSRVRFENPVFPFPPPPVPSLPPVARRPSTRHSIAPSYYGDPAFAESPKHSRDPSTQSSESTAPLIRVIPVLGMPTPPALARKPPPRFSGIATPSPARPSQRPPTMDFTGMNSPVSPQ
ncbi:hypothetical protein BDQ12DRAFT_672823 [Crucibulum laeve]|uniref:Transmembrane protein n=1 Tax=Crucibulum laeve TaxID=68775 RepID=A0A5C3MJ03_9AGAR|nr:hypothetical protein BDQ12DRAFT_672823 [Crucibulum laeve]